MIKHGHAKRGAHTNEYDVWNAMNQRCSNPNCKSYPNYGGRGISVCERWSGEDGYKNFIEDMGPCPDGRSLDRIDNSQGYSPENCRWATRTEQQRNRDCNVNVEINGEVRCVTEWAEILGINIRTVRKRMNHLGWDAKSALLEPVIVGSRPKTYEIDGSHLTAKEWSKVSGVPAVTIRERISDGWTVKDAVFTPKRRSKKDVNSSSIA